MIVSGAPLIPSSAGWKAYGPYVKEMELWAKYADEMQFCCPVWETDRGLLISEIPFDTLKPIPLREFDIKSVKQGIKAVYAALLNFWIIIKAMRNANHIHLRCPGNIGLLGCLVQILFPNTPKTAKYAGNWDPNAKQPLSYRIQKWILSNTFLTRNMQVLVYGEWEGSSKNIKPFFTASYKESDKHGVVIRKMQETIRFLFVGTLTEGKRPLYAVQLVEQLLHLGYLVHLDLYGEGKERSVLVDYIQNNELRDFILLHGNQPAETVQKAYQESHFLLLPSKSEGWPKVVAEAMFWGCVPVASSVSCVPTMLDKGNRGVVLAMVINEDCAKLKDFIDDNEKYQIVAEKGMQWSRKYTLDYFETEIKALLKR
ncbi:glycosyl transferase, group 1 family protein [Flavobacterium saliperosum S13]|uniref:Glycosyl transferase, group 1 family protein n=1 Tax=Flavobacterium saliperosum S13 TaxID=1341155 RepID=A0ABP3A126_9FLAO|nr:glycosyl transferase, group 1 family protein [Flavobacterium saliperosum S13]